MTSTRSDLPAPGFPGQDILQTIPEGDIAPSRLIGARSFLIDRAVPACEFIDLPAKTLPAARLELGRRRMIVPGTPPASRLARLRQKLRGAPVPLRPQGPFHDCRRISPQNWAHLLNDQLPLHLHVCAHFGEDPSRVSMLLPADMPDYGLRALALFGIPVLATDGPVEGDALISRYGFSTALKGPRAGWAAATYPRAVIARVLAQSAGHPERVFLSRRDTRKISNMAEIAPVLERHGFVTIFPESLSVEDQIRLFHEPRQMLAIHGAGLAPLLYRQPDSRLQHLIEILPCGHMSDNFRVVAQQVGLDWIGLRGRLKPEYVAPAQDFSQKIFKRFSLDDFEVDPVALETALQIAGVSG